MPKKKKYHQYQISFSVAKKFNKFCDEKGLKYKKVIEILMLEYLKDK